MKQFLVVLICLSVFTLVVLAAPTGPRKSCCLKYSKSVPNFKKIKDYEIQEDDGSCSINAVVFRLRDRWICSNPKDERVKKLVEKLSQKEQRGLFLTNEETTTGYTA
uniref:C-C motif chemokine 17-like n=1 Tax=Pristiophorus japonicus TaxID=55135 RepID=UPI00398E8207